MKVAILSPFRVFSRRNPPMIPPIETSFASVWAKIAPVVALAQWVSSSRKRSRGCPVMKKPRDSFSKASRSASPQSGRSSRRGCSVAPSIPNRLDCPCSRSRVRFWPVSIAKSREARSVARWWSSESKEPLLMKLSTTLRFTARRSTLSQKSRRDWKGFSPRAFKTTSTADSPTFLIAERPNRIPAGTTVKWMSERFTSGGRTSIPMSRHSPMWATILSVFARSEVRSAAMKNRGWFAFRYAVWYARRA
jgi:hypothetical protein